MSEESDKLRGFEKHYAGKVTKYGESSIQGKCETCPDALVFGDTSLDDKDSVRELMYELYRLKWYVVRGRLLCNFCSAGYIHKEGDNEI